MFIKLKKQLLFLLFTILIGGFIGSFISIFLAIMNFLLSFIWEWIPNQINIPFYTIIVCLIGGLIIGLYQIKFGDYPEELEEVLEKVKKDKKYPYNKTLIITFAALLPLIFGASVGPEAGLTGVIVGLCYWASDKFKYAGKHIQELTSIGISSTLGVIFKTPLFGVIFPIENESDYADNFTLSGSSKFVVYITSALSALGFFTLINYFIGGSLGLPRLTANLLTFNDFKWSILLLLVGLLAGCFYNICLKSTKSLFKRMTSKKLILLKTLIGGLVLGIVGTFFHYSMFSGEEQLAHLADNYLQYTSLLLILVGFIKIFLTAFCIQSGWKGGHFFPIIFAGASIGYGCGMLLNIEPVFCVCLITSALFGLIMKKTIPVVLLLMICFPIEYIIYILLAAVVGNLIGNLTSTKTEIA